MECLTPPPSLAYLHPRAARCLAVPAPIPELAPVISTTRPVRLGDMPQRLNLLLALLLSLLLALLLALILALLLALLLILVFTKQT